MSSSVRPQSAKTTSSSAAAGGGDDDVVKPPVSAVSAMIRSAITIAQNSEGEASKKEGRTRDREFYGKAVDLIASGKAAGMCLELNNPNRTRADELAAILASNIMAVTGGGFKSTAALLLDDEGAEELAARDAWPPQLHWQMERALKQYDKQMAARRRELEREEAAAKEANGHRDEDGDMIKDGEEEEGGEDEMNEANGAGGAP